VLPATRAGRDDSSGDDSAGADQGGDDSSSDDTTGDHPSGASSTGDTDAPMCVCDGFGGIGLFEPTRCDGEPCCDHDGDGEPDPSPTELICL
jgi:hypothetical protein